MSKEKSKLNSWLKEVTPSHELSKWFGHDPEKWLEFQERYREELKDKESLLSKIKDLKKENGKVTLIYAAKMRNITMQWF
jgi:uncharacterized protein YeaO (DUF488 family)